MAEAVEQLKSTIDALERRVHELEARLQGKLSPSLSSTDGMRMILIGPPGAGMLSDIKPVESQVTVD
jgi:adenylate kinase